MKRSKKTLAVAVLVMAVTAGTSGVALAGDRHELPFVPPTGQDVGHAPAGQQVTAHVLLAGRDPAGLAAYASAVSDPGNANYGHFLSAADTLARYGTSPAQHDAVVHWLQSTGLAVTDGDAHAVVVHGTVAQAETAFATRLDLFHTDGLTTMAPATPMSVPANLGSTVLGVTGLNAATLDPAHSNAAHETAGNCSQYYGEKPATGLPAAYGKTPAWEPCGYSPEQLRGAYHVTGSGLAGAGTSIAIILSIVSPTIESDANRYAQSYGDKAFAPGQLTLDIPADGADGRILGDDEGAMDLEAVHAMAPEAKVTVVMGTGSVTGDRVLDAIDNIVDHRLADVLTSSYTMGALPGEAPAPGLRDAAEQDFQQAAVEGISVNFPSGDGGGKPDGTAELDYPCASAWVTCVGGTTLAVGPHDEYAGEIGWEDTGSDLAADGKTWTPALPGPFRSGAGGGVSTDIPQPVYQSKVVPPALSTHNGKPMRTVPDISALGDFHTGMAIGLSYPASTPGGTPEYRTGVNAGTSLSTPLIAGLEALVIQARHGKPLGFANPLFYGSKAFRDITDRFPGSTDPATVVTTTLGSRNSPATTTLITQGQATAAGLVNGKGYDTVTGIGSPAAGFLMAFCG
ncbi:S53 family peptidase [Kutzneria sp. CA-103260]|uniref:S53 family peptidase n=1 Tax=Kutzneria sp. CA-103260 TaxID=2802641 RepID=UPI001BA70169|nr:S53 family peptidase [Kutzneria sp. CA-103260]QUQ63313.1 serine protease [Kutzneria sp. CA-103260]